MHGLIFFYIQKFAEVACTGTASWVIARSNDNATTAQYLPSGVYPDAEAVELLQAIARSTGRPLPLILEQFGEFLAPHLLKVAAKYVDPGWRTLDLIERTESIIHSMIRNANPGAAPPVLETVRPSPDELHLVYGSSRQLCPMAKGLIRGLAMHFGDRITIDESSYSAKVHGKPLDLTYKEFQLLHFFATHPSRVFTREQLLSEVWGYDYFGGTRTVDVHVRRLRAKLGDLEQLIGTVRNVGYRFNVYEDDQPPVPAPSA